MEVTDFEIVPPDPSPLGKYLRQAVREPLDKIYFVGNIKSLRVMVNELGKGISLCDARWAIEHWPQWIQFIDQFNRLPENGYGTKEGNGKLI